MQAGVRRALASSFVSALLFGLVQCGGQGTTRPGAEGDVTHADGGEPATDPTAAAGASAQPRNCAIPSADGYQPLWMPPKATPGACTPPQIARAYTLCQDPNSYDEQACRAFNVDSANSHCLDCLFTANGSKESGALVLLQNGYPLANVGGCEALLDGDASSTSCGARTQAAGICEWSACLSACTPPTPDDQWNACLDSTRSNACAVYNNGAACAALPRYARCQQLTFADYFITMGDLFCGAGPPPLTDGQAGAAGAPP